MRRVLLALAVVVASLLPVPAAAQSEEEPDGDISLAAQTTWLGDEGAFELSFTVDDAPDDARIEVVVHRRVRSRSAFVQSVENRPRGTTTRGQVALSRLPSDGNGNRTVSLLLGGEGDLALPAGLVRGVYPVTVALEDADGEVVDRFVTHLVRLPQDPDLTPLSVAWIQPLGTDPALEGELGDDAMAEVSPVLDALATSTADLTLEATPETLAALPDNELEPVQQLVGGGAQLLSRPYVDVDPDALVAAGLTGDLVTQRQAGEEALFAAVGTRGDPRTWTTGEPLGLDALTALRGLGITRMALPAGGLEPLDDDVTGRKSLTRPFDLDAGGAQTMRAVAIDAGLTEHFRVENQVLGAHRLLADLAVLFSDAPGTVRGVAVRPPDDWEPNTELLGTVLPALASSTIVQPVTLERLLDTVDPLEDGDGAIVRREVLGDPERGSLPGRRIFEARAATDELAELTGASLPVVAAARLQVLVAESSDLGDAARRALLADVLDERDDVEGRITIADRRTYRLTAREGTIPLTVLNGNAFPVQVQVVLSSDKLEFPDAPAGDPGRSIRRLTLEPGTHTETVPVKVRASGTFQLRASILTPGGHPIRRGQFIITSSAFSGVGVVLSIGAGVFLLAWWARHWRTVRRDRRLVAPQ